MLEVQKCQVRSCCHFEVVNTTWDHELNFLVMSGIKEDFEVILIIGARVYVHYTYGIYVMYSILLLTKK